MSGDSWQWLWFVCPVALALGSGGWLVYALVYDITRAMSDKTPKGPSSRLTQQEIEDVERMMAEEDAWEPSMAPPKNQGLRTRRGDSWTGVLVVFLVALAIGIALYLAWAFSWPWSAMDI